MNIGNRGNEKQIQPPHTAAAGPGVGNAVRGTGKAGPVPPYVQGQLQPQIRRLYARSSVICAIQVFHYIISSRVLNSPPSGPLFYRLAVIYDRGGVKEQHVGDPGKINELQKGRGRDIADIDERYLGIPCCKKRSYTAAERITKNDESAFTHDVWV